MIRKPYRSREHQPIITNYILDNKRCNIWADMGTGKTVATLSALDILFMSGWKTPVLVLGSKRIAQSVWPNESLKWQHLTDIRVRPIVGNELERKAALLDYEANVFTTNYENLPWLAEYLGDEWPFEMVIADESTRLKSFRLRQGGKRAQALARVAFTKIKRFVNLTGSPAPNGVIDLWGQNWFIDAGFRLGRTFTGFTTRWFRPKHNGFGVEIMPHSQKEIEAQLKDVCLTILAKDYFDLIEPVENELWVTLPTDALKKDKEMEREMFTEIEKIGIEAFNAGVKTIKRQQIANGAVYVDKETGAWAEIHTTKIKALEDIIEEANGMPVLVAYHFKPDLERLLAHFPTGRELDDNPATIDDWNSGNIPVLFAHPASAGHGLNLQYGSNIIVYFSVDWNLELHEQIKERMGAVRQAQAGFDRPLFVHYILAKSTIDELIIKRLRLKQSVQDILLEAMKQRKGL